jgi:hypothetical protein
MATRLTPETLRRIVLEEKKKIEAKSEKALDKKALKELQMEMDEDWPGTKAMKSQTHTPGNKDMKGPGATMKEMRDLRAQEELLRNRLQKLQERRLALRKKIIAELG